MPFPEFRLATFHLAQRVFAHAGVGADPLGQRANGHPAECLEHADPALQLRLWREGGHRPSVRRDCSRRVPSAHTRRDRALAIGVQLLCAPLASDATVFPAQDDD
jgi:hypothetical protein